MSDWAKSQVGGIILIPDNTTTELLDVGLGSLGSSANYFAPGQLVGRGNLPYDDGSSLSVDPIPVWPNPDGPSLEDVDPPNPITNTNTDLLHGESGAQPFTVSIDSSQVRNRVFVIGSGSINTSTAVIGDIRIFVSDISSFSPSGGKVRIVDPATGKVSLLGYTGVEGVVGRASIVLSAALITDIVQGSALNNFFQADDKESQRLLAAAELDHNGLHTDGIHEYTIVDTSLKATFQLYMRAYAELELFAKPIVTITYATRDPKSKSGQMVHVDLTNPPCIGDFLIQSVTIDQIHDDSDQLVPRYTVTASSTKFDLNDLLLQILGGQIGGSNTSSAGIVPSATASSAPTVNSLLLGALAGRRWTHNITRPSTTVDAIASGLAGGLADTGASAGHTDTYPGTGGIISHWVRFTPALTNFNTDGYRTSASCLWENRPKFVARFRTANILNGGVISRVYVIGLAPTDFDFTKVHVALIATNPSDSSGNWATSILANGVQHIANVGFATILPDTYYIVTIEVTSPSGGPITEVMITVHDVTHNTTRTAHVSVSGYHSTEVADDNWSGVCYGTSDPSVASLSYIDISSLYLECD